jgi:hypothetical protein
MATTKPTITTINDTFTTLVTNTNTVSLDLGATGRLNTNQDSSAVAAINELELGIRGASNNLVATDLADFTANNIVSALHELDSDLHGVGGGNAKADLTTNAKAVVDGINELEVAIRGTDNGLVSAILSTTATNLVTGIAELDSDIGARPHTTLTTDAKTLTGAVNELDSDLGARESLGTINKTSVVNAVNELETAIRGTTANYTISTSANDLVGAVNELDALQGNVVMGTSASTVTGAIAEHDAELGDSAMGTAKTTITGAIAELEVEIDTLNTKVEPTQSLTTTATTLSDAVNELDALQGDSALGTVKTTITGAIHELHGEVDGIHTEIGSSNINSIASSNNHITGALVQLHTELGSAALDTSANTHTGAINELHTTLGQALTDSGANGNLVRQGNVTFNNVGLGLHVLDSAIGNLVGLNATDVPAAGHNNLVSAINEVAARVTGLDASGAEVDSRIGSLSNLHAAFTGTEDDSIVNAINALRGDIPLIFNENGVQLN